MTLAEIRGLAAENVAAAFLEHQTQVQSVVAVVLGTTLGMMAANVPAVLLSHALAGKISLKIVRAMSGLLFAFLDIYEVSKMWHG